MMRWLMRLAGLAGPHPDTCGFCGAADAHRRFPAGRFGSICAACALTAATTFPRGGGWDQTLPPNARCSFCGRPPRAHVYAGASGFKASRVCAPCLAWAIDQLAGRPGAPEFPAGVAQRMRHPS